MTHSGPDGTETSATEILQLNSKSFYLASRFLPNDRKADVATLYAWCRYVDDSIDEVTAADRQSALARLGAELDIIYRTDDEPISPHLRAMRTLVRAYQLPRHYADELLAGMASDAGDVRLDTADALMTYCWRVAGVVGLMMTHVLGLANAAARRQAAHLGMAMQLTNICRDVAEDWQRGRCYLPVEWFASPSRAWLARQIPGGPLPADATPHMQPVIRRLLVEAKAFYASAEHGLPALPPKTAVAIAAASRIYAAIGGEIRRAEYDPHAGRAVVSTWRKWWCVMRAVFRSVAWLRHAVARSFVRVPLPNVLRFPQDVLPI